jgi:DNA-binding transcriptional ArsR family regulator
MPRPQVKFDVFHALADPTRRRIVHTLARGELPVMAIVGEFNISQPSVSEHLRILLRAGVVRVRPAGRTRHYCLDPEAIQTVRKWADSLVGGLRTESASPQDAGPAQPSSESELRVECRSYSYMPMEID